MPKYFLVGLYMFCLSGAFAQRRTENLTTDWPAEYKWQVVNSQNDDEKQTVVIIPGNETVRNATIIGVMSAYRGRHYTDIDQLVSQYKNALDTGSILTIVDSAVSAANPWVIFKVETPSSNKYHEPESDLYFVIQGEFAVFEDHVALKDARLPADFIAKWGEIFKQSKLVKN